MGHAHPLFIIFLFIGYGFFNYHKKSGKVFLIISGILISLFIGLKINHWANKKIILDKSDFYGTYIIDRDFFPGKQADWQYNHFRFDIKENDSIYFYETNEQHILKTYKGSISVFTMHSSARLVLNMKKPTSHVLNSNPTIYRESWDFYLVFESPKFYNMYFRRGVWEPIKK